MADMIPTEAELDAAYRTLKSIVRQTPLLESPALNEATGARVLVKAEALQITGSFKIRGAYYRLTRLNDDQRAAGVIAFSSGNFAQGLAAAGELLGIPVTIVMPEDAPPAKIAATRGYGADVMLSAHGKSNREVVAAELARATAAERGMTLLHPFDDLDIIAGQASVGLEILGSRLN
jgi:threonine dehydratase